MVAKFLWGGRGDEEPLGHVDTTVQQMLGDDRHSFDLAISALLSGANPEAVGPDLFQTDQRVNEAEQRIRRELIVHASARSAMSAPATLVYMSLVKDVERIGDYAKNIFDLAAEGIDLSSADDREELYAIAKRVSEMITQSGKVFAANDVDRARELSVAGNGMLDDFDRRVNALLSSDELASIAVPRALLYRYQKRIVSHLMNLLSAVFMPVDRLDYFDEPDRDSASHQRE
jgi:phosphate uptake regulator